MTQTQPIARMLSCIESDAKVSSSRLKKCNQFHIKLFIIIHAGSTQTQEDQGANQEIQQQQQQQQHQQYYQQQQPGEHQQQDQQWQGYQQQQQEQQQQQQQQQSTGVDQTDYSNYQPFGGKKIPEDMNLAASMNSNTTDGTITSKSSDEVNSQPDHREAGQTDYWAASTKPTQPPVSFIGISMYCNAPR